MPSPQAVFNQRFHSTLKRYRQYSPRRRALSTGWTISLKFRQIRLFPVCAGGSSAVPADILNYAEGETANSFIKGNTVFSRNWPYQWGEIAANGTIKQDQVNVAPLPGSSTVGGWLLGINKNSKNIEGAWAFIKYLATDGQKTQATTGGHLPGYSAMLEDADVLAANSMLSMEGFQGALATTVSRPVSPEYGKCSDAIINAAHAFLSGNAELDATAATIEAALAG